MPQKKYFVATEILVFDFELFIGDRYYLLRHAVDQIPVGEWL